MAGTIITGEGKVHEILSEACACREMLILVTPYLKFESNFLSLDSDALHVRITMSAEEAIYGLRNPDLRFRFPFQTRFLEGRTRMLGFGLHEGRKTIRLAIPASFADDEQRRSYRVERVGRVNVTFSDAKFRLHTVLLQNLSLNGAGFLNTSENFENFVQPGARLHVTIPLSETIHINWTAVARWTQDRLLGVEFVPPLPSAVAGELGRWVFKKREEDKERLDRSVLDPVSGTQPKPGNRDQVVLVSLSADLEGSLREMLPEMPSFKRIPPTLPDLKAASGEGVGLFLLHLPGGNLDERRRLKTLAEALGKAVPFVLLGTDIESGPLFELANEMKASSAYVMGPKPSPFFQRLLQGILRRQADPNQGGGVV